MSNLPDNDTTRCFSCKYFEAIIFHLVGECVNDNSGHRGHIISSMHPACPNWKRKK